MPSFPHSGVLCEPCHCRSFVLAHEVSSRVARVDHSESSAQPYAKHATRPHTLPPIELTVMDTDTPNPSHALSGHNPTLFNVVAQYADMDMLRALAVTSGSLYETLQHSHFDHLTMVVLEAPILKEKQQVVYNGANPVPGDTFLPPFNDTAATLGPKSTIPDTDTFEAWRQRSTFYNRYSHNLVIPDYARNFMARAQSVELVVYRRRLGTRISSFFIDNAHRLKYGGHTTFDECASHESASATTQYRLHLPCAPTPHAQHWHCNTNDGHTHGDDGDNTNPSPDTGCIFSKHRSHEYFEDDGAESRRLRFHKTPSHPRWAPQRFPFKDLPSLQLKLLHNTTDIDRDDRFSIVADVSNTYFLRTRFANLPLAEQQAPTTSLKIRAVDCVCFDGGDWTNAMPGCTIQPTQTWFVDDNGNGPYHPRNTLATMVMDLVVANSDDRNHIGHSFSRLTSLILQFTRLDEVDGCGIDALSMPSSTEIGFAAHTDMSYFFIDNAAIPLPHLRHFGVIGTLLDCDQFAKIVFDNAHTSSLSINPGPQPTDTDLSPMMQWICAFDCALNWLEATEEDVHEPPRPRRKYNFSFDFAKPHLESICPDDMYTSTRGVSSSSCMSPDTSIYGYNRPTRGGFSEYDQHLTTCATLYRSLILFHCIYNDGSEIGFKSLLVEFLSPPPRQLVFPNFANCDRKGVVSVVALARLAHRTLAYLQIRCHYCSHTKPGSTVFPGASPGDCTATRLPKAPLDPLNATDSPQNKADEQMYMDLRRMLHIPPHVVLRL